MLIILLSRNAEEETFSIAVEAHFFIEQDNSNTMRFSGEDYVMYAAGE